MAAPNSPQHLTRPGFGSPAEPACEIKNHHGGAACIARLTCRPCAALP